MNSRRRDNLSRVGAWQMILFTVLLAGWIPTHVFSLPSPVFLSRKAPLTQPYMLLSTHVNPSSENLAVPQRIQSQEGHLDITLTVEETRVVVKDLFEYNARGFCWQGACKYPAPSIFVRPGDECSIRVVNKLPAGSANTVNFYLRGVRLDRETIISQTVTDATGTFFVDKSSGRSSESKYNANPRPPNVLAGIPGTNRADILLRNSGQGDPEDLSEYYSVTYRFTIPLDHEPGMHYYHSNAYNGNYELMRRYDNGEYVRAQMKNSALHMMEGLVGAFHVLPLHDRDIPDYPIYECVLTHLMLAQNSKDISEMNLSIGVTPDTRDMFTNSWTLARLHEYFKSKLSMAPTFHAMSSGADRIYAGKPVKSAIKDVWLTNGQYQPSLSTNPEQWLLVDLLAASSDRHLEVELRDAVGYNSGLRSRSHTNSSDAYVVGQAGVLHNSCDVRLVAMDGVSLMEPRAGDNVDHLVLLPGSRARVAMRCMNAGTYYLQSTSTSDSVHSRYSSIGDRSSKSAQVLLKLIVSGRTYPSTLSITNHRSKYLHSQVPLPYYATTNIRRKWTIGLEQRGANNAFVDRLLVASNAESGSLPLYPADHVSAPSIKFDAIKQARYWMGQGVDCSLPCYQDSDCEAYFGSDYNITDLFNVRSGACFYNSACTNHMDATGIASFMGIGQTMRAFLNDTADIVFYSRYPQNLLPMSFADGVHVQIIGYEPASAKPASVTTPALTETTVQQQQFGMHTLMQFYGEAGDWRDTLPVLPGRTAVRAHFTTLPPRAAVYPVVGDVDRDGKSDSVTSWIHCNALKFEDTGLLGSYDIVDSNGSANQQSTPVNSVNGTDIVVLAQEEQVTLLTADSPNGQWSDLRHRVIDSFAVRANNVPSVQISSADGLNVNNSTMRNQAVVEAAIGSPFPPDRSAVNEAYKCQVDGSGWYYREVIDRAAMTRTLTTNGCPNHFSTCQEAECGGAGNFATRAVQHPETVVIPLYPRFATMQRDAKCTREKVGLALNGVGIFGRADSSGTAVCYSKADASSFALSAYLFGTDATSLSVGEKHTACNFSGDHDGVLFCGDEVPVAAARMDRCAGFADRSGIYKYHIAPACLIEQLSQMAATTTPPLLINSTLSDGASDIVLRKQLLSFNQGATTVRPSPQVGWALDGFPIYGPVGTRGILMKRCRTPGAHATVCLDDCNGYKGSIDEDHFMYRYYMAGEIASEVDACSDYTENAYIDSVTGRSVPQGSKQYIQNGNAVGTNAYTGCQKLENKCCISSVPSTAASPYTIGCFMGCKYGEQGCVFSGEKGTTALYEPRADTPTVPTTIHVALAAGTTQHAPASQSAAPTSNGNNFSDIQAKQAARSLLFKKQLLRQKNKLKTAYGDNVPQTSSYLAIQQISQFDRPISLIQVPFGEPALALVDAPDNSIANGTKVTIAATATTPLLLSGSANLPEADAKAAQTVSLEVLPSGFDDAVLLGLTADAFAESALLYFTTRSGVYALNEQTKTKTHMIAGYTRVVVDGFNLGSRADSVQSVTINGHVCDSPVWESSMRITCVLSAPGTLHKASPDNADTESKMYTADDVVLLLDVGSARGIHPEPTKIRMSKSGRPAITSVSFEYRPFLPRAITTVTHSLPVASPVRSVADFSVEDKILTSKTFSCDAFTASNTNSSVQDYQLCEIEACDGDFISASTCAIGGSCTGDTHFSLHYDHVAIAETEQHSGAFICDHLHDCPEYTYRDTEIAQNNNLCGLCSGLTYQVPPDASRRGYVQLIDGRRVPVLPNTAVSSQCHTYYLRQGCWKSNSCAGNTQVTVTHTEWATPEVLTLQEQEQLQANVKSPTGASLMAVRRTLYYSDTSEDNGAGILRCWLHVDVDDYNDRIKRTSSVQLPQTPACTQLEVVSASALSRVQGLVVIPASCAADGSTGAIRIDISTANNICDLILFVDASSSSLGRILIPALVPGNVYDYRQDRRVTYIPPYSSNANIMNMGLPVRLLIGLVAPQGLSVDAHNAATASSAARDIAIAVDASSYSRVNGEYGTVGRVFVSLVNGLVKRFDSTLIFAPAATVPLHLDAPELRRVYGWTDILESSSQSRLGGIASVPLEPSPTNWTQHRCFVVDANQQAIYATTEWPGGAPSAQNTLNLGVFGSRQVLFPVQISVRPSNESESYLDLYVAEYLGKIWRIRVPRDPVNASGTGTGRVLPLQLEQGVGQGGPVLLLDESEFPASVRVRKLALDAMQVGEPVSKKIFFEGLQ